MPAEVDLERLEAFLEVETGYLDEGDLDGWVGLCTEDAVYWMPVSADQTDPLGEISILYENRTLMELRRFNFGHRLAPSFESDIACSHLLGRPKVLSASEDEVTVRVRFHCIMWYRNEERIFAGYATYGLVPGDEGYKLRSKRVDLINAGAAHKSIPIYI